MNWRLWVYWLSTLSWFVIACVQWSHNQWLAEHLDNMTNNAQANYILQQQVTTCNNNRMACMNDLAICRAEPTPIPEWVRRCQP